ncbi:MAG: SDR family NAD(P)-dependent oxidoreductase [Pseudomonadota bacterium]
MQIKHAVVTGASAGIGAQYVQQLATRCDSLLVIARRGERLSRLAEEHAGQCDITGLTADLSSMEGIASVVEALRQGPEIDLLVNNAGFSTFGGFTQSAIDDELAMVRLHIDATLALTRAVLFGMRERSHGAVVNVASVGGFMEADRVPTYGATKAFLISFTRSLAKELLNTGVIAQCLCPGYTRTEIHDSATMVGVDAERVPEGLWTQAEEVVSASLAALQKPDPTWLVVPGEHNANFARASVEQLALLLSEQGEN